jgi:branched-chain amino acid transport system permease protein
MTNTIWSGLALGAIYALVASGFTVSMLPSGVFNFAQGALVLGGCYLMYTWLVSAGMGVVPAILLNVVAGLLLGVFCELVAVRPLHWFGGGLTASSSELVTTVGLSTALVGAMTVKWGTLPKRVPFHGPSQQVHFLGVVAEPAQIIVFLGAIVVALGLHFWFRATRHGQACLAIAEDREAAQLRGVNVNVLSLCGFAAAGALAGLTAVVVGPITYAVPTLANTLALGGFVAIALGGESSFLGGLLGGLLVGVASSLATRYLGANYSDLAVLALLIATLAVRPRGLGGIGGVRHV